MPHFAIIRLDKSTTKIRVVFDALTATWGVSLNDNLLVGPKLQNHLDAVLMRFHRFDVAICCDICEMYLQVMLAEEDRAAHCDETSTPASHLVLMNTAM